MKDSKQKIQEEPLNFLKYIKPYKFERKIPTNDINYDDALLRNKEIEKEVETIPWQKTLLKE